MSDQITVVARLRAKEGKEQKLREELKKLLAPTHQEKGCINYDMHESTTDKSLFLFHENWTSENELKAHFETPHIKNLLAQFDELLAEPLDVTLWKKVE